MRFSSSSSPSLLVTGDGDRLKAEESSSFCCSMSLESLSKGSEFVLEEFAFGCHGGGGKSVSVPDMLEICWDWAE